MMSIAPCWILPPSTVGDGWTFSGGTEVTACNPRTVAALKRCGIRFSFKAESSSNPHYAVAFSDMEPAIIVSRAEDFTLSERPIIILPTVLRGNWSRHRQCSRSSGDPLQWADLSGLRLKFADMDAWRIGEGQIKHLIEVAIVKISLPVDGDCRTAHESIHSIAIE
jgi:hypothetical protein